MIYQWRRIQDGRRGEGDGESIDKMHILAVWGGAYSAL